MSVPANKNLASQIMPCVSSALRDLDVFFEIFIWSSNHKLADAEPAGTFDSWSRTQNEQENTHNHDI